MKKITMGAFALLALATSNPAQAADLRVKAPPPVYAPVFSWSGFYIGVNLGAGAARFTGLDYDGIWDFGDFTTNHTGWTAGGQVGFNYQVGPWVLGVEADINWTSFDKVRDVPLGGGDLLVTGGSWDWFSTLRGRVGVAFDRAMAYVTAGVAWANVNHVHNFIDGAGNNTQTSGFDDSKAGFVAGAGVEYAFTPNWSLKAEYLYIQLTTHETFSFPDALPIDFNSSAHIARLGLNYRFGGWGKGPVVARY